MKKLHFILAISIFFTSCIVSEEERETLEYQFMAEEMAEEYSNASLTTHRVANSYFDRTLKDNRIHDSLQKIVRRYDSLESVYRMKVDSVKLQRTTERLSLYENQITRKERKK